jgi:hypothetical protein
VKLGRWPGGNGGWLGGVFAPDLVVPAFGADELVAGRAVVSAEDEVAPVVESASTSGAACVAR